MRHLTDDELIEHFCGEADRDGRARLEAHLGECDDCRRAWEDLVATLTMVDEGVPEPPDGFERVVWARVQAALDQPRAVWSWRQFVPAGALVAAVVIATIVARPQRTADQAETGLIQADAGMANPNERVLYAALDEHFQQTEALLVELKNAPDRDDLGVERVAADDLLAAGRLYRQTAAFTGNARLVRVLDELEPLLVEVARGPERFDQDDREWMRARIDQDDLIFKVRVATSDVRARVERP
jgi:hypothetical protein